MSQHITRRLFAAGLALAPTGAFAQTATAADKALVDRAVAYLQGLTRAKGRFSQTDARGKVATGDIYLQRPGKVRFEYDAPNQLLVISDGNQVAILDERLGTDTRYPLATTPLALFLAREIRLDRGVQVTNVNRTPGGFTITARDTNKQTPGQLVLDFADQPMSLRGWTTIEAQGRATRLQLTSLSPVNSLDTALFRAPARTAPGSRRP